MRSGLQASVRASSRMDVVHGFALSPLPWRPHPLDERTKEHPSPSGGYLEKYFVPTCHPFVSDFCHVTLRGEWGYPRARAPSPLSFVSRPC